MQMVALKESQGHTSKYVYPFREVVELRKLRLKKRIVGCVFDCHVAVRVPMCLDSSPDVESCSGMETRIQEVLGSITS